MLSGGCRGRKTFVQCPTWKLVVPEILTNQINFEATVPKNCVDLCHKRIRCRCCDKLFHACFACLQSNKGFYSQLKHNCIYCNHTSDNTELSQETPITRVGGTTAPVGSDDNAGSTSFWGDNDGGFDFDTDKVQASVPAVSDAVMNLSDLSSWASTLSTGKPC